MNIHEKFEKQSEASGRLSLRDDPGYDLWFGLAQEPLWKIGGKLAAVFVGLATIYVGVNIVLAAAF